MKVRDIVTRNEINFTCLQETKLTSEKVKVIDGSQFKL